MTITRDGQGWLDQPGVLLGILNLGLGAVLILGAPSRTSSPSLAAARDIITIHHWGLLFLLGGVICLYAHHLGRRGAFAVGIGAGIHFFWAAALYQAATWDERAGLTGIIIYGWAALIHITTGIRLARRSGS